MRSRASRLAYCFILCVIASSITTKDFDCEFARNRECYNNAPHCSKITATEPAEGSTQSTLKCLQCAPGFEAIEDGVSSNFDFTKGIPKDSVELCKRSLTAPTDPLVCGHPDCTKRELPNCLQYTVTDIKKEDNQNIATFTCLTCNELFEPLKQGIKGSLNVNEPKRVCTRKDGTFECGELCQSELPGCKKFDVSDVEHDPTIQIEKGYFTCSDTYPGYTPKALNVKASTSLTSVKEVSQGQYLSDKTNCNTYECMNALPNCEVYYTKRVDEENFDYTCLECKEGYSPADLPIQALELPMLVTYKTVLPVCKIKEVKNLKLSYDAKMDYPGCSVLTVGDIQPPDSGFGFQTATYTCDQCDEGFSAVTPSLSGPVVRGWGFEQRVKVVCHQNPVTEAKPCDENLRKTLRNCQEYTLKPDVDGKIGYDQYTCTKCDSNFKPVRTQKPEWFYLYNRKHVCSRKETDDAQECTGLCQNTFPHCESIQILVDDNLNNEYICKKCAEGFYPIAYSKETPGFLKKEYAPSIHNSNTIQLCSNDANEIYGEKVRCNIDSDLSAKSSLACRATVNCVEVALVINTKQELTYFKCLECPQGTTIKAKRPGMYDIDQTFCQTQSDQGFEEPETVDF